VSGHAQRLAELHRRIAEIDAAISDLVDNEYASVAGAFDLGDQSALNQAAALESKLAQLRSERQLCASAQAQTEQAIKHDAAARVQEERRQREAAAKQLAGGVVTLNGEIDAELVRLREMLERRAALLHQLGAIGANVAVLAKLAKPALTRAACHHGLAKFVEIARVAPTSLLSLVSTNMLVMGLSRDLPTNGSGVEDRQP
jgi:hypothetical protein